VILVTSTVLLPLVAGGTRRFGLRRVQLVLARTSPTPRLVSNLPPDESLGHARRTTWLVDVAGRRGPWPANCLQRSLVGWWFLRWRGVPSELRIGARRASGTPGASSTMQFHAWLELEGTVINDHPSVREQYASFDRAIAPASARFE